MAVADEDWVLDLANQLEETGESEVSAAIWQLLYAAMDNDADGAETVFPQIVAYARHAAIPWLEVCARHWRLQTYLGAGLKVGEMLPEAVSLLAMSARDENRGCPESRCAVQDVALCYGFIDAPSYAQERLAVIEDLRATLKPGVGCFGCMAQQAVGALCSIGRYQEALDCGLAAVEEAREAGEPIDDDSHFWNQRAREWFTAALGAGALDWAAAMLRKVKPDDADERAWLAIAKARLEIARGDLPKAAKRLPKDPGPGGCHGPTRFEWLEAALTLAEGGALENGAGLAASAVSVAEECEANGRLRSGLEAHAAAAALALQRGEASVAGEHLERARALRPRLRASHGADEALAALAARLEAEAPGWR
jgi:tetratricopeptide (TPR) repeat protein